jgi:hypothetical protein
MHAIISKLLTRPDFVGQLQRGGNIYSCEFAESIFSPVGRHMHAPLLTEIESFFLLKL